jgi:hypothetical protein
VAPAENNADRGKRVYIARLVLLIGIGATFLKVLPALPSEQHLLFRFDPDASIRYRRVEVSWNSQEDGDVFGGFDSEFSHGAPPILERTISLPNGRYEFSIRVLLVTPNGDGTVTITRIQHASLEGGQTTLLLKDLVP